MEAAPRWTVAALGLLAASCVAPPVRSHRTLPPPAPSVRAGAPARSAGPGPGLQARRRPDDAADAPARVVAAARRLVGQRAVVVGGTDYGAGCTALVRAALEAGGRPLPPEVRDPAAVHALATRRSPLKPLSRAAAGDVLFLGDVPGGAPAHVGIVARVEGDGAAVVLHRTARGVFPLRVGGPPRADGVHRATDSLVVNGKPVPVTSLVLGAADLLRG